MAWTTANNDDDDLRRSQDMMAVKKIALELRLEILFVIFFAPEHIS